MGNDVLHVPRPWQPLLMCSAELTSTSLLPRETFMKQSTPLTRGLIAIVATAMIAQTSIVRADMIGAEAVMSAQSQAEQDRAKVQSFVDRATVKERLQAMGVSGLVAKDRVASLTEAEVHALAQRIDAMPAGGALSANDLLIVLLIALLVAVLI
jgi:hypothetical protein